MNVAAVMTKDVIVVAPRTPLKEVARLLVEHRVSGLAARANRRSKRR